MTLSSSDQVNFITCSFNEGYLNLPSGFSDYTVNVFVVPTHDGGFLSLTLTRALVKEGVTLVDYVAEKTTEAQNSMADYHLRRQLPWKAGEYDACIVFSTYGSDEETVDSRDMWIMLKGRVLHIHATMPEVFSESGLDILNKIISSLHLNA